MRTPGNTDNSAFNSRVAAYNRKKAAALKRSLLNNCRGAVESDHFTFKFYDQARREVAHRRSYKELHNRKGKVPTDGDLLKLRAKMEKSGARADQIGVKAHFYNSEADEIAAMIAYVDAA